MTRVRRRWARAVGVVAARADAGRKPRRTACDTPRPTRDPSLGPQTVVAIGRRVTAVGVAVVRAGAGHRPRKTVRSDRPAPCRSLPATAGTRRCPLIPDSGRCPPAMAVPKQQPPAVAVRDLMRTVVIQRRRGTAVGGAVAEADAGRRPPTPMPVG
ncbi:hypothetical protein ABZ897_05415 [Nonomuraea sp. NPDC046802]|uniref:hypothetical protein n=1 Tax=Nonomuraea sp. NPDC046802 TaxID=3154919 RepID=UPI0033D52E2E